MVLIPVIFTIVYGCSRALKETHLKRRLAWSTVSNLSYILFGVALMSPLGLVGALTHMICHAVIKICSFFCAGAVICQSGREYIYQLDGLGKKMPKTFAVFTVSGLALMGVPGLAGFVGKWNLVKAALDSTHPLAVVGVIALMISALLTAIYMLTISVRAFVQPEKASAKSAEQPKPVDCGNVPMEEEVKDPGWMMLLPLVLFVTAMFVIGLHPQPLINVFTQIASAIQ